MTRRRMQLVLFSGCWLLVAIANFAVSDLLRWHPDYVGGLALATAIGTLYLALIPSSAVAYRASGTLAIGTLGLRVASLTLGYTNGDPGDAPWFAASAAALAVMLGFLYWNWWLREVKAWHEAHRDIRSLVDDSG